MDAAGVNACAAPPAGLGPEFRGKIAEEAAAKYPNRFAILGNFPLDKPENRRLIDGWKSRPGMLGLRYAFTQPHQANWMTDGTMDWLWPACEKAGIPIALMASNYLPQVGQIAERHPGLKLIIDHLCPGPRRQGRRRASATSRAGLRARQIPQRRGRRRPARPAIRAQPYPYPQHPQIHCSRSYEAFGPQRTFWGTDITRMPCSWKQCVTMFTEELPWLKGHDLDS